MFITWKREEKKEEKEKKEADLEVNQGMELHAMGFK